MARMYMRILAESWAPELVTAGSLAIAFSVLFGFGCGNRPECLSIIGTLGGLGVLFIVGGYVSVRFAIQAIRRRDALVGVQRTATADGWRLASVFDPPCPSCGSPLVWVHAQSRWFCTREGRYL